MIFPQLPSRVQKKSAVLVRLAVTLDQEQIAQRPVVHDVLLAQILLLLMEVTSLLKPPPDQRPQKPPLSAYAKSPRQLQQLTDQKENKYAATCS
jgi:hypothetical protein